mmetsp:Transcript_22836/g.69887  ORF Transcript_22836/g.69887 Transcript_22836/m.69887 type:complete len:140 (-) Transcript_22836:295-714(-)|eukprot:scaffold223210_cov32-Tisochrysis_lutea.AAC.2
MPACLRRVSLASQSVSSAFVNVAITMGGGLRPSQARCNPMKCHLSPRSCNTDMLITITSKMRIHGDLFSHATPLPFMTAHAVMRSSRVDVLAEERGILCLSDESRFHPLANHIRHLSIFLRPNRPPRLPKRNTRDLSDS